MLIWLLYILFDASLNWYLIVKKGIKPTYLKLFFMRVAAAILYGGLWLKVGYNYVEVGHFALQVLLLFPFLFNTLLNTFRKLPLDYVGEESGWIDSKVYDLKMQRVYYWVTLILFIIAIKFT